jgi:hypothetical protein
MMIDFNPGNKNAASSIRTNFKLFLNRIDSTELQCAQHDF